MAHTQVTGGVTVALVLIISISLLGSGSAQQAQGQRQPSPADISSPPLGDGPFIQDTAEQHRIRVTVVTKGLSEPRSLAWLPDGSMLVTERVGRLRVVRQGKLEREPVSGLPTVRTTGNFGLHDAVLHPQFSQNGFVYLTYSKSTPNQAVTALARGRLEGSSLLDVTDLLLTDPINPGPAGGGGPISRLLFGRDGMLYMSTGGGYGDLAQQLNSLRGKVLRLRDDGSPAPGNPFAARAGARPEIYSLGHRNTLALIVHPVSGDVWNNENGPNGGDEVNIIRSGGNYGWPVVSYGRTYEGPRVSEDPFREGWELPTIYWVPSIAASGMAVYTGDRFPAWKGDVFVGAMRVGEIGGTGHLQRIVLNEKMEELRRESLLTELRQRIREVRQGPDGLLYLLTDETDGAVLRIEPAP